MATSQYKDVINGDESLSLFLATLADFDRRFCDSMVDGRDFTLKLEIHGNKGELLHCRVLSDDFRRPNGVEKTIDGRSR